MPETGNDMTIELETMLLDNHSKSYGGSHFRYPVRLIISPNQRLNHGDYDRQVSRSQSTPERPHLFLSHSSKDKDWVHALAGELNICEVDVWLDDWELSVGDKLAAELGSAVERSRYLAILISDNFHKSEWGKTELELALAKEKVENRIGVLFLLVGTSKIPALVKDRLFLDFRKNYYHALSKLVGMLRDLSSTGIDAALKRSSQAIFINALMC